MVQREWAKMVNEMPVIVQFKHRFVVKTSKAEENESTEELIAPPFIETQEAEDLAQLCAMCDSIMQRIRYKCRRCQQQFCVECAEEDDFDDHCPFCETPDWSSVSSGEDHSQREIYEVEQKQESTVEQRDESATEVIEEAQELESSEEHDDEQEIDSQSIVLARIVQQANERRLRNQINHSDAESTEDETALSEPALKRRRFI